MSEIKINPDRMCEIATMALHKLQEIDRDMAQRFFQEEIEMDEEETKYMGVDRIRQATEIEWDIDQESYGNEVDLPNEVEIPWDILDDDIDCYLTDKFGFCVCSFNVEEDEL